MAAEVSSLNRNPNALITQDLLAGLSRPGNTDNRINQMSGESYLRGTHSPVSSMSSSSSSSGDHRGHGMSAPAPEFQDLNYPPTNTLFIGVNPSWCLDLKLDSPSPGSTRTNYQSVCTLDKVKSALERAEQETINKRPSPTQQEPETKTTPCSGMFAAACPGCLLYVITQKTNPKCPRCNSMVPCPSPVKKPRIDLNAMQQSD